MQQLLNHILIFLGSASAYRTNKLHFLSQPKFLPRILSILSSPSNAYPLKSKAFAAQTLWVVLHNHQGVKAAVSALISKDTTLKTAIDWEKYIEDLEDRDDATDSSQNSYREMYIEAFDVILDILN